MSISKVSTPDKITLRAYQVGFGDCFLLTFHYGNERRSVLIDFGSTGNPNGAKSRTEVLRSVANNIYDYCGKDSLQVVVATHRHADHINGFAPENGGNLIAQCNPKLVLQPWTEDEKAPGDGGEQYGERGARKALCDTLDAIGNFAEAIEPELKRLQGLKGIQAKLVDHLELLRLNNLGFKEPANGKARGNLNSMGIRKFLSYSPDALELEELPGVKLRVLGPPTLAQSRAIRSQTNESSEFYVRGDLGPLKRMLDGAIAAGPQPLDLLQADGATERPVCPKFSDPLPLFNAPTGPTSRWAPQHTRWFLRRMNSLRSEQLLELVRVLDGVLNNTSLILLFEVGDQKLLFPGDAQLENWSYALKVAPEAKANLELLQKVTLYKVGHHGSRNATPKVLWKQLEKNDDLCCVMSTKPDQHGHIEEGTEVPRTKLIELFRKYKLYSTQDLECAEGDVAFLELEAPASHGSWSTMALKKPTEVVGKA